MTTRHKHADLIIAWANGAEIEYYHKNFKSWNPANAPVWREDIEYRIKPKPLIKKYQWACNSSAVCFVTNGYYADEQALRLAYGCTNFIWVQRIDPSMKEFEDESA